MSIPTISYLDEEGNLSKSCKQKVPNEILLKAYKVMCLTRHLEERMITLQRQGLITFAMSSRGEEACAVASAAALEAEDWIYPQYREAGVIFWRGFSPEDYVHHMFGNAKDRIKGRQMPNHFGARECNVVTVSSPIGTKIPHAAGCAFAMKLLGEKSVAVCYFGEGASSEGDFHAGLRFAAVKRCPVIFFCRNNGWAISTPASLQFATDGVAPEGIGHGLKVFRVDGNDFFAVYESVSLAREHCLAGGGPVLIEAMTYRLGAHSTSDDPSRYRSREETEEWKDKCPIRRLGAYLRKQQLWNDAKEKALQEENRIELDRAIEKAKKVPPPAIETLIRDVYFETPLRLHEQLEKVKNLLF